MKRNYELNEYYECVCKNFAAEAADSYEYSNPSATKLQNSIRYNLHYSCNS